MVINRCLYVAVLVTDVAFSFDKDRVSMLSLLTSGIFCTSVAWAVDEVGNILVPPTASTSHNMHG